MTISSYNLNITPRHVQNMTVSSTMYNRPAPRSMLLRQSYVIQHLEALLFAPVTLCRLGFPTRPDFEVGVSRGRARDMTERLGIGREGPAFFIGAKSG